ncbi:MAG: cyclopropane-fatty-acyl-phospholipid synthase family protein [Gammaproteobacteria bacterium]|nr:cyclopropane-fatty-acyl-phospholipid synthase family protein [Gammaproteobacteria bacterium]
MNQKSLTVFPRIKTRQQLSTEPSARWIKEGLLQVLGKATCGHLILRERGQLLAEFGNRGDSLQAEINIVDTRVYKRALLGGNAAAGEAYVDGWWTTPDIAQVTRFFSRNLHMMDAWSARFGWLLKPVSWLRVARRMNSHSQAKRNILAHYDLGNQLYSAFLDPAMQYSSAIYRSDCDTLEQAQRNKMLRICEQLQLDSSDHLIEIGTGWCGLAIYAASNFGCRVTTTTISDEQYKFSKERIQKLGLADRITVLNKDYRELEGQFDKLVSVEMIEAVGRKYLPGYFGQLDQLLKPGGLAMIQAITIADQRFEVYSRTEDFIQKHIFPGGFLPSLQFISQLLAKGSELVIRDIHDMGLDYARTLKDWRENFMARTGELEKLGYGEQFHRLWEYYLGYCEGGFLERRISAVQLLASKSPHYAV